MLRHKNKIYDYFVSYESQFEDGRTGISSCTVRRNKKIRSIHDVESIQADIAKDQGYKTVIILFWEPFEK